MNPWATPSLIAFLIATGLSIACAIYAHKCFWKFKTSKAGKAKITGYSTMALAFCTFALLLWADWPVEYENFIRFVGILIITFSLGALLVGLMDFNRFQNGNYPPRKRTVRF